MVYEMGGKGNEGRRVNDVKRRTSHLVNMCINGERNDQAVVVGSLREGPGERSPCLCVIE